jgi:adenylate kinase family enzyme
MPILGVKDPLPYRPGRVLVAGGSGSGKTTLAARVGGVLGLPFTEMDSLYHGPNWVPRESFVAEAHELAAQPQWATEWQYSIVRPTFTARADLMIWLDLPRRIVMTQVVRRTVGRRWRREKLWNDNVEPPLRTIFTDREHIVRWAWNVHPKTRTKVLEVLEQRPELPIVQLTSRSEVEQWCNGPLAMSARR